ncbi:MAG: hypothetical protein ACFFCD_11325 [Promethearchaeota archaeon]
MKKPSYPYRSYCILSTAECGYLNTVLAQEDHEWYEGRHYKFYDDQKACGAANLNQ